MKRLRLIIGLMLWACLTVTAIIPPQNNSHVADSWTWPLGSDGYHYTPRQHIKYGLTAENTSYGIRNLDLILGANYNITCFGVGAHRIYHAGVDLYRVGESTANAEVRAIANGVIVAKTEGWPGDVILIEHTLPDNSNLYSLYAHLEPTTWSDGDMVSKNELLGYVARNSHNGHFPEFHPDGDDAHLHFEIRTFYDASIVLPDCAVTGVFGSGYTYPDLPDSYGYIAPLQFLGSQQIYSQTHHLPLILKDQGVVTLPLCEEGQDLLQNNGLEGGSIPDPTPWLEVSTAFDLDPLHHRIQTTYVFSGERSLRLGGWSTPLRVIDEEFLQQMVIPVDTTEARWEQIVQVVNEATNPDGRDYFILTLKDAQSGLNLLAGGGVVVDGTSDFQDGWYRFTIQVSGLDALAGRPVALSYVGFSDDDLSTSLLLDSIYFYTTCAGE